MRIARWAAAGLVALGIVVLIPRLPISLLAWRYPDAVFHFATQDKRVALTIDDGPHPEATPAILAALATAQVCATFFVLGEKARAYPDLVTDISAGGHAVAAHFWRDEVTFLLSEQAVAQSLAKTLSSLPESAVPLARPGYGVPSDAALRQADRQGVTLVSGDLPAFDTHFPSGLYHAYLRLVVRAGSIVTYHSGADRGARTAHAIGPLAADLKARGYRFVKLGPEAVAQPCR